jgi:hypothetical protein
VVEAHHSLYGHVVVIMQCICECDT